MIIKYLGGGSLSRYPSAGAVQLAALGAWLVGGKPSHFAPENGPKSKRKSPNHHRSEAILVLGSVLEKQIKSLNTKLY